MTDEQKALFKKWQYRTLFGTIFGYALFYIVRKNFSMAMPGIEQDLGITKTDLGLFLTLHGLIYGVSQFINGTFADRKNARWYMTVALMLAVLANVVFGFSDIIASTITGGTDNAMFMRYTILVMGITWVFNGMAQSAGFPPCARLLTHWVPPSELATKQSIWNTSHSIGAGFVVILCGYIMQHMGTGENHSGAWRYCFLIPAAISGIGAILLFMILRDTPKSVGLPELEGTSAKNAPKDENDVKAAKKFIVERVLKNPLIWILCFANFFVYVVRYGILDWGPMLLKESKEVSLAGAGWLVAGFEIAGITGVVVAGILTDKLFKGKSHQTCMFCMLFTALFIALFWFLPTGLPAWVYAIPLCGAGFCVYGPQGLIGVAAANLATKKAAGSANGMKGMFGYLSTLISGLGFGYIAQHFGWNAIYMFMITTSIIGMGIFIYMWNAPANGYDEQ